jgi:hypothetical protein
MITFKKNVKIAKYLNFGITNLIPIECRKGYNPLVYTSAFTGLTPTS